MVKTAHSALLVIDLVFSFYVTFGFIAGTFEWSKYGHPFSRWYGGKITKREIVICTIVAILYTPMVATLIGRLFGI